MSTVGLEIVEKYVKAKFYIVDLLKAIGDQEHNRNNILNSEHTEQICNFLTDNKTDFNYIGYNESKDEFYFLEEE